MKIHYYTMIYPVVLFVISFLSTDAYAYLDPGSGGIIIQLLIGGAVGVLAILRMYWANIKKKLSMIFIKNKK